MKWQFDNDMPIYTQLVGQIKFAIVSGALLPGSRMMTVRDLALEAGVNPNTMQRALQQLEREGLVYSQRSSGRFVTEDVGVIDRAKAALAAEHIRRFRASMGSLGYSREEMIQLLEGSGEEEENG
ncbi:MAG: GntR family transcriptional regulator [Oscillospiraceae bacterium]|nr:GntR family transcriptional regulator [Oscillospiraceae bacterium]